MFWLLLLVQDKERRFLETKDKERILLEDKDKDLKIIMELIQEIDLLWNEDIYQDSEDNEDLEDQFIFFVIIFVVKTCINRLVI
jgi:hypothetical protein